MFHYIVFLIVHAFNLNTTVIIYLQSYLQLVMNVCIYGVNNYLSSFTVLISFILSIVFVNLANAF